MKTAESIQLKTEEEKIEDVFYCLAIKLKHFWCRCGWGHTVPIPNTTVKTQSADGTALETVVGEQVGARSKKKNNRLEA